MDRRDVLKAAGTVVSGAALLAAATSDTHAAANADSRRGHVGPITTEDGTLLFYRDWGSGPPIVFLSGWGLHSAIWSYVMVPAVASGYRCIAYDRRGHGRSDDPGRGYDFDTLADDLAIVLDKLNLKDVTLVAHSMSGGEAVRYLSRTRNNRVSRLVLMGTTLPFLAKTDDNPDGIDPAAFERLRGVMMQDLPKWLRGNSRPSVLPETSEALMEWGNQMILSSSLQALMECNRALTSTDFRAELQRLTLPVLLIHGDRDVSTPLALTAQKTVKLLRDAQLKIYAGGPHGLPVTHPMQVKDDIIAFTRSDRSK
jgi:pimeloyl-ACP methyl ester carboxylesterase